MRPLFPLLLPSLLLAAACAKPADKSATPADTTAAPAEQPAAAPEAAPAAAGPQAIVAVLYRQPKSPAAFEKYYAEKHLPLVSSLQSEIGFTRAELTKFTSTLDGKHPTFYRQAELYFPSMDALQKGMATEGFKKVGADLKNFATGGLEGLVAVETGDRSDAACPALVAVVYHIPKDSSAFESYYSANHLPLVSRVQGDIGFNRADLTKFTGNLDGSAPAEYRQAELCFPSMDALKKGMATDGFKQVGGDLKNFATGGLVGLIGEQQ
ncbi:MAG TPA: EthD family reductase [Gemmatimonadales bacterium]|nr:EthD family reductase [Gemmatimonadales bacterium]